MLPIIAAALIGAGASVLGSVINGASNKNANDTSIAINNSNQDWQEYMLDKQNQFSTQMWNENNEYNSPRNQVLRLQQAGINPSLALSSISPGSASSVTSSTAPSASIPNIRPTFDASSLSSAIQAFASVLSVYNDSKRADADVVEKLANAGYHDAARSYSDSLTQAQDIKNFYLPEHEALQLDLTDAQIRKLDTSSDVDLTQLSLNDVQLKMLQYQLYNILPAQFKLLNNQSKAVITNAVAAMISARASQMGAVAQAKFIDSQVNRINQLLPLEKSEKSALIKSINQSTVESGARSDLTQEQYLHQNFVNSNQALDWVLNWFSRFLGAGAPFAAFLK